MCDFGIVAWTFWTSSFEASFVEYSSSSITIVKCIIITRTQFCRNFGVIEFVSIFFRWRDKSFGKRKFMDLTSWDTHSSREWYTLNANSQIIVAGQMSYFSNLVSCMSLKRQNLIITSSLQENVYRKLHMISSYPYLRSRFQSKSSGFVTDSKLP